MHKWHKIGEPTMPHKMPVIYRFICPDGRSYVGSTGDIGGRNRLIGRVNKRLTAAFKKYPPQQWQFEIIERLPSNTSWLERFRAEQRHIERLRTSSPKFGFNSASTPRTSPPDKGRRQPRRWIP